MFEKITKILLASILVLSLASCSFLPNTKSPANDSQSKESTDAVSTNENTPEESDTEKPKEEAKAFTNVQSMMTYFVNYFHEPYMQGDKIYDEDILTLVFHYCYSHQADLDYVTQVDEWSMEITGEGVRYASKMLFGENFDANEFHGFMEGETSTEKYDSVTDTYDVPTAKGYWGGDTYYLEFGKDLDITETENEVVVIASVYYAPEMGVEENFRDFEYTFEKVVYNGFEYLQIKEVREV